jgi:hypothetical protein
MSVLLSLSHVKSLFNESSDGTALESYLELLFLRASQGALKPASE